MIKLTTENAGELYGADLIEEADRVILGGVVFPKHIIGSYTVGEGDPPPPAPEAPAIPASVSPRQFRQALDLAGMYDMVEAAVASADRQTKIWWEYATSVERNNGPLNAMAGAMGVTQEQLDGLFTTAATL